MIIEIIHMFCLPEPWPERGNMVRWPTCCREWSMCSNISTNIWAYPRSDSFLRGNLYAHTHTHTNSLTSEVCACIRLFLYFFSPAVHFPSVHQLHCSNSWMLRGLVPCSTSLGLFGEQHNCKNGSFPVASSQLDLCLQLKYSRARQPNCWKVVTVFGWRYFAYYILFMQIFIHTRTIPHIQESTGRKPTE